MPAPSTTATGSLGKALVSLAWLIASTTKFQTVTGAASATAAMAYVHIETDDTADTTETLPRAIVHFANEYGRTRTALNEFSASGTMIFSFEFASTISATRNRWNEFIAFMNDVELIISQMEALVGTGTGYHSGESHLQIDTITLADGPGCKTLIPRMDAETPQNIYGVTYAVTWSGY